MPTCYQISNLFFALVACVLFFACMNAATIKDDCDMSNKLYGWLIYYGIYDMFACVNMMVFIHTFNFRRDILTSYFNFHTLFIIIPNTIVVLILGCMGDLHRDIKDCNKMKFNMFVAHWMTYSIITFFICYIGMKIYLINKCTRRIEIEPITNVIDVTVQNNITVCDTNNISECIVCFENKKMYSLKCKHTFCYDCIMKWNKGCMLCRDNNV